MSDRGAHHGESWEDEVLHHLRPGYVVLGVGNRLKADDGVGSILAERLAERGLQRAFDCGGVPENYAGKVAEIGPPDVLFIDAVDFGAEPGRIGFFGGEGFAAQSVSTHSAGLSPLMDFLAANCEAACYVLAVQPGNVTMGGGLSEPVARAAERILASDVWFRVGA